MRINRIKLECASLLHEECALHRTQPLNLSKRLKTYIISFTAILLLLLESQDNIAAETDQLVRTAADLFPVKISLCVDEADQPLAPEVVSEMPGVSGDNVRILESLQLTPEMMKVVRLNMYLQKVRMGQGWGDLGWSSSLCCGYCFSLVLFRFVLFSLL